jgi:hypothetical protein
VADEDRPFHIGCSTPLAGNSASISVTALLEAALAMAESM